MSRKYNSKLKAGRGIVAESRLLFSLYEKGMSKEDLFDTALTSGLFPTISARRLKNIIYLAFEPRFMADETVILHLKSLDRVLPHSEFQQLLFLYACRASPILGDFVRDVYWPAYAAGRRSVSNDEAREFVDIAVAEGRTVDNWSDTTRRHVASALPGTCADFGLLEGGRKLKREIRPLRIRPTTSVYLAYDLHFQGLGDNTLLFHKDWRLFGLDRDDVLDELQRMALQKWIIAQTAVGIPRIDWLYDSMEKVIDVIIEREL
jgi:hypothetical protein